MKENVLFSVTTNAICLEKDEILEFLVKNNFITNISFDGPVQDLVRVDMEGKGTFKRLVNIIEKVHKKYSDFYKNNVGFNVTVTPATDLPKTVEFFHSNSLFTGKTLNIIRNYDPGNLFCKKYDFVENEKTLSDEFEKLRREYPNIYKKNPPFHSGCFLQSMVQLNKRPMGDTGTLPLNSCCYPGMNCVFIDVDGTVCACERTEHAPIGNVNKSAVDDKVVEDYVKKYYDLAKKLCPHCWAARLCPKCFSHVKRGDLNEKNFLELCDKFRASVLKSLELFVTIKEKDEKAFDDVKIVTVDINQKREERNRPKKD
jgi:radical SAM protein with 4Fe4S-binding SPASM domain